jgi:cytochrome c oxidase assembly protein subunit 15
MTQHTDGAFHPWRHRFAVVTAASTLALVYVGALVTTTGSGLAVPDWPLSYGMLMPPMVGGVFYEHGHRMAASAVGLLTLVLAIWTARAESRRGVRILAWVALAAVVAQGLLGGLTVLFLLPTPVSVAHACLAQTFLCLTVALAYATSREWVSASPADDTAGLRGAAALATAVVFGQLLLGAVMRHIGAGLAIPDFPLSMGRLVPPMETAAVAVHFAHRLGAIAVLGAVGWLVARARRSGDARSARLCALAVALVTVQVALGALAVLSEKAIVPTTSHVALGAAILALTFLIALRARRIFRPRAAIVADLASAAATGA